MTLKKIALVLPSLRGGGAERTAVNLAQGFLEAGFSVDLILLAPSNDYYAPPSGVPMVNLNQRRVITGVFSLARYLRKEQPEAVIGFMNHVGLATLWARSLVRERMPVFPSVHNNISGILAASGWKEHFIVNLMRRTYPQAERVICVSHGVEESVRHHLGDNIKTRTIYNPVVTPDLLGKKDEPVDHRWLNGNEPVIVGAGRLTQAKDFSTLLRAFKVLRQQIPARLIILGEGPLRAELEAQAEALGIQDAVDLPGFAANPYAYMSRADLFVLSSQREGLPGALIEAMACGCPVVSTDCMSGPREILEDGRYGTLVPVGNAGKLAEAMAATLKSPLSSDMLTSRADEFSLENITAQYIDLLTTTIESKQQHK
jgi:glycosyltransferase involved in cell wall biosynthesis